MTDPNPPAVPPAPQAPAPGAVPPAVPPAPGAPQAPPAPQYVPPTYMPGQAPPPAQPAQPQYVPPLPTPPAEPPQADPGKDWAKLPEWARTEHEKLKSEAAARRISERTALVNQHAYIAAGQLGANAAALLGSVSFAEVAKTLNPSDPDFASKLSAAIHATVQANPWMAAAPTTPTPPAGAPPAPGAPRSGGDFAGAGDPNAPITEAQLKAMSPQDITKALAEGRLKHLL